MKYLYAAIAQYDNRDAGHVCYGRTKDEARTKARQRTTMSVVIRRERASHEHIATLTRLRKL